MWINEIEVGRHRGGFSPFSIDITESIWAGESKALVVRARDRDDFPQPRGKQTRSYEGHGALYGRTTGIWQTVWMEPVPLIQLKRPRITPDLASKSFLIETKNIVFFELISKKNNFFFKSLIFNRSDMYENSIFEMYFFNPLILKFSSTNKTRLLEFFFKPVLL